MSYPRFRRARAHKKAKRVSGSLTLNSTNWADVDSGLDLTLPAQIGDDIEYGFSSLISNTAVAVFFDAVTVVSGTVTNSFASDAAVEAAPSTALGVGAWYMPASRQEAIRGSALYTLVAGDLVSGAVTLRLRYATNTATNRVLQADGSVALKVWAKNLGPAAT